MACELVHSYLDDADYGYDQINVGSSDFNRILDTLDANHINNISTIREREIRMFNKLNAYQPLQTSSKTKLAPFDSANPNLFSLGGEQRIQLRNNVKADVENYYYGTGNEFKDQLSYPKPPGQCNMAYPSMLYTKQTPSEKKANKKTEGFQRTPKRVHFKEDDDVEQLQDEIDKMEQKNNMLLLFIFFLVVIVLVQYAKHNNDPLKIVLVPVDKSQKQTPETINEALKETAENE
jgi:hypothetical protein